MSYFDPGTKDIFGEVVMTYSKSFGYAVRGLLYIAIMQNEKRYVQVEEIAAQLAIPRHFMGKILKNLAKKKMVLSVKGPAGGFTINDHTLSLPLLSLINITDGLALFDTCVLRLKECNPLNPCLMHNQMEAVNEKLKTILSTTTIGDLIKEDKKDFIRSISTHEGVDSILRSRIKEKIY